MVNVVGSAATETDAMRSLALAVRRALGAGSALFLLEQNQVRFSETGTAVVAFPGTAFTSILQI